MKIKGLFILALSLILLFSACGKDEASEQKKDDMQSGNEAVEEQPTVENEQGDIDQNMQESEILEPEIENMGEGAPDSAPIDIAKSDSYHVGDTIRIVSERNTLYELTIDEVAYTDKRDEYVQDPGNVILITYTYTNLTDEALLIDDMRFQLMMSDEETLFGSYYLADIQVPEMIEKDGTCTAQIAYASAEKPDKAVLAYQDTVHTEVAPVKIIVDNLQ